MRYGYDLRNPKEMEMYVQKKQREYQRAFNPNLTPQEKYIEYIKEQQKEFDYFQERDRQEKELEQMKTDFIKEVEEETETAVYDLLNLLKFD